MYRKLAALQQMYDALTEMNMRRPRKNKPKKALHSKKKGDAVDRKNKRKMVKASRRANRRES
ncbi:MAG: hypothetical protein KJ882_05005 [Proteobacteria bacterium]|nr:hypothetical protein [Pseudomonadota bacterium]MBU4035457.1 hypothetical protein [Pseudomonadota bacterium]